MAKRSKDILSQDDLDHILNTTGELPENLSDLDSEDEGQVDNLEFEELYDSDIHQGYIPEPSDVESDESSDSEVPLLPPSRKKARRTSTPAKRHGASRSLAPAPAASMSPAPPAATSAPSTSAAPAASTSPARKGRRRRGGNEADNAPSIVDFHTSTVSGKAGFRWSCRPQVPSPTRTPARNIIQPLTPGPTREVQSADTPERCFRLLFEDHIIEEIVEWTNKKIAVQAAKFARQTATHSTTEPAEVRALLGILIFSGCQRDGHLLTSEMWSPSTGAAVYRVAMSQGRFEFLLNCLRFDDPDTREVRQEADKLAPLRKVWDIFIGNCGRMYMPSENITVDEQLLAFRGSCPFRMYIPNKPAKYGLKIFLANDNKSKYLLSAIPYLGKQGTPYQENINLGHYYTKELTRPYHKTNRNVTTDNWFTSVPLAVDLLENCGMTFAGTIKANKKEVPKEMTDRDNRRLESTAFLFTKELTLVSYVPTTAKTKKKLVLLLSSMHTQPTIGNTGKPEVIEFYNATKGGVDTFDQMCAHYSCARKTKRWPLCMFYGMVNAGVINSWIIHKDNMSRTGGKLPKRRTYMQALARALITPWAEKRLSSPFLSQGLKALICSVCDLPSPGSVARPPGTPVADSKDPLVRCVECPNGSDRKTRHRCHGCRQPMCPRHFYPVCANCEPK
ncbi:PiggyBac transposable element-derived protein 4-like 4 [Homarus americanus]|uniref:PiggyBac transposable element-derived protein 4-like 4 n=2 Tax=Homarus americanus TaxID=6706 RepID=A0A8J5JUE3_HOMAM|nr:PiggyBac transposable element-derived protein 4-like 4 [Homarus americanus]